MTNPIALPFRVLGYAGLIPFAAAAATAALGPPAWRAPAVSALLAYGAVILSFLGAVHWGVALRASPEEAPALWPRLVLGVLPAMVAWLGLLAPAAFGLVLLAASLCAVAAVETMAARRGRLPRDYLALRWRLSLGAAACLLLGAAVA